MSQVCVLVELNQILPIYVIKTVKTTERHDLTLAHVKISAESMYHVHRISLSTYMDVYIDTYYFCNRMNMSSKVDVTYFRFFLFQLLILGSKALPEAEPVAVEWGKDGKFGVNPSCFSGVDAVCMIAVFGARAIWSYRYTLAASVKQRKWVIEPFAKNIEEYTNW